MASPLISIIIPVLNEEKRLLSGLEKIKNYFDQQPYSYEVVIVNNGSDDNTVSCATGFLKDLPNWQIISLPYPAKGLAFKTGFLKSQGDFVLLTDIDLPVSLEQIAQFWEAIKTNDLAMASKYLPESKSLQPIPSVRRLTSFIFNYLGRKLLGLPFHDTQCGFKLLKREPLLPIVKNLKISGLCFDVELLNEAYKKGLKIKEMPIRWENRRGSKIKLTGASLLMFFDLLRIKLGV